MLSSSDNIVTLKEKEREKRHNPFHYNPQCPPLNLDYSHYTPPNSTDLKRIHMEFSNQLKEDTIVDPEEIDHRAILSCGLENQEYCMWYIRNSHQQRSKREVSQQRQRNNNNRDSDDNFSGGDEID